MVSTSVVPTLLSVFMLQAFLQVLVLVQKIPIPGNDLMLVSTNTPPITKYCHQIFSECMLKKELTKIIIVGGLASLKQESFV